MVVKIQRSFPPNDSVLIYTQDRKYYEQVEGRIALDISEAYGLEQGDKIYAYAQMHNGRLDLKHPVPDRDW